MTRPAWTGLPGWRPTGVGSNRAAARGRAAREAWEDEADNADFGFTKADEAALDGRWSWVLGVVRPAIAQGPGGAIDDDLAAVSPWGFHPSNIDVPVLLVHGGADCVVPVAHARCLADRIPGAELWERPTDGHITALHAAADTLAWLSRTLSEHRRRSLRSRITCGRDVSAVGGRCGGQPRPGRPATALIAFTVRGKPM